MSWWESGSTLGVITGTGALGGQYFTWDSEDITYIYFVKTTSTGTLEGDGTRIKFQKSSGAWSDHGSDWPSGVQNSADNSAVEMYTNGPNSFVNPNVANPYGVTGTATSTTSSTVKKVFCNFW